MGFGVVVSGLMGFGLTGFGVSGFRGCACLWVSMLMDFVLMSFGQEFPGLWAPTKPMQCGSSEHVSRYQQHILLFFPQNGVRFQQ